MAWRSTELAAICCPPAGSFGAAWAVAAVSAMAAVITRVLAGTRIVDSRMREQTRPLPMREPTRAGEVQPLEVESGDPAAAGCDPAHEGPAGAAADGLGDGHSVPGAVRQAD